MKYATAVFAATLLFTGAASAQSMSDIGQYHKDRSNMQNTSDTTPSAKVETPTAACGANGTAMTNTGAAATGDATQMADANANAKCSPAAPQAAQPMADPGPK